MRTTISRMRAAAAFRAAFFMVAIVVVGLLGGCAAGNQGLTGPSGATVVQPTVVEAPGELAWPPDWNPQQYGGINRTEVEMPGGIALRRWDGKERAEITAHATMADGSVIEYRAGGVTAFDGQAIRGEVEKVIGAANAKAIEELVPGFWDVIAGAVGRL